MNDRIPEPRCIVHDSTTLRCEWVYRCCCRHLCGRTAKFPDGTEATLPDVSFHCVVVSWGCLVDKLAHIHWRFGRVGVVRKGLRADNHGGPSVVLLIPLVHDAFDLTLPNEFVSSRCGLQSKNVGGRNEGNEA